MKNLFLNRYFKSIIFSSSLAIAALSATAFTATAQLAPYTLTNFENKDFRDWTFDEMVKRLGVDSKTLAEFKCDGKTENTLFPPLNHPNLQKNSLQLKAKDSDEIYTYQDGELIKENGSKVRRVSDEFLSSTYESLKKIESLFMGHELLQLIQQSPRPLQIVYGTPKFSADIPGGRTNSASDMAQAIRYLITLRKPDYPGMPFTQIGYGGFVYFDPEYHGSFTESDDALRPAESFIVLGHELFHAFDGVRGLLDRRNVNGAGYEFIEVGEYRATYFENQLRKEAGLLYRKFYSPMSPGQSLLDSSGKPYLLPSPCLK